MKKVLGNFFSSLPPAARWYISILALAYPLAWLGRRAGWFDLYSWLGLVPALVWKGQIWRAFTYAFLPAGPIDWVVTLFWLATLVALLARNWSGLLFWTYNLTGAFGGALLFLLFRAHLQAGVVGGAAMLFALVVAWERLYRNERLVLVGIGEISVRQAAILIALLNSLILFFTAGWFCMVSMWCGGLAGWLYLSIGSKRMMNRAGRVTHSERMARLEL